MKGFMKLNNPFGGFMALLLFFSVIGGDIKVRVESNTQSLLIFELKVFGCKATLFDECHSFI